MFAAIVLVPVLYLIASQVIDSLRRTRPFIDKDLLIRLFWFHAVMSCAYYLYVSVNRSDSVMYFHRSANEYNSWGEAYRTGTKFIDFIAYPLVNYLGFNYAMLMVLFSLFGYLGFVYFYVFLKENVRFKHTLFGYDILVLILFLPNMHFWTASLGKGSLIFLGLGMVTLGMSNTKKYMTLLLVGLVLVYHIRPHVFLFMVGGIGAGYFFGGNRKIPAWQKWTVITGVVLACFLLYKTILTKIGIDSENAVESFNKFTDKRAFELAKSAGSGVDISNYPIPLKLFTFWYRPLFIDSPNALGIFVSTENLLYLLLTAKLFHKQFIGWVRTSSSSVKACIFIFLLSSFALSTTMSNLGIIQRQKSMVMYFLFFVILSFLDYLKLQQYQKQQITLARRKKNMEMCKAVGG